MIALVCAAAIAAPQGFIDEPTSKPASAQVETETAPEEDEAEPKKTEKAWYQSFGLSGFADVGYGVIWPGATNTFFVGQVEADLEKKVLDVARLRIDVNLLSLLPWQPLGVPIQPSFANVGLVFDNIIEQAFGEWFPLGEQGPQLRLGKYNALVAYERQDPIDRFMVSTSLVFTNGSPWNFTGVALDVPLPASLQLTIHGAVNGWDYGIAPTRTKTVGAKLGFDRTFKRDVRLQLGGTFLYGTNRFADDHDYRLAGFFYFAVDYGRLLTFAGEATYGQEPGLASGTVPGVAPALVANSGAVGISRWGGLALWGRLTVPRVDWLSFAARYDYFDDPQRTRGLVQTFGDVALGGLARRQEITGNVTAVFTEGMLARVEYTADLIDAHTPDLTVALRVQHRLLVQGLFRF